MPTTHKKTTVKKDIDTMYPLSPLQEGFLFHALLDSDSGTYTPQVVLNLKGELNTKALNAAWHEMLQRHAILRSGFYWEQRENPFQVVFKSVQLPYTELDWTHLDSTALAQAQTQLIKNNRDNNFDLKKPALLRIHLARITDNYHQLFCCYHHLILDGWSSALLLKDVFQCYLKNTGKISGTLPPPRPYADYIAWLNKQNKSSGTEFWKHYLSGIEGGTFLSTNNHLHATQTNTDNNKTQTTYFTQQHTLQLRSLCQSLRITMNTLVQACFALVLKQATGNNDVIFGTTSSNRPENLPGSTQMVGLFINSLPVRIQVKAQEVFSLWAQEIQNQQAISADFSFMSLREIQQKSNEGSPLFDSLLVFESYPVDRESFKNINDLSIKPADFDEWTHYPLTLLVTEGETLQFSSKYRNNVLPDEKVSKILYQMESILKLVAKEPNTQLYKLTQINSEEAKKIDRWNKTYVNFGNAKTLLDLLDTSYTAHKNKTAVIYDQGSDESQAAHKYTLTYNQLHQQVNALSHKLIEHGINIEDRVGVHMHRSTQLLVSLLAILKVGAVYVPIEPSYPQSRQQLILENSNAKLILTNSDTDTPLTQLTSTIKKIDINSLENIHNTQPPLDIQAKTLEIKTALQGDNAAYTIYTSGSTGIPKGVVNTHRGIINRLQWMQAEYTLNEYDRVLLKTPLGFDVSIWELLWPLISGAAIVIAQPEKHKDPEYLSHVICRHNISTVHFVPPMLAAFLDARNVSVCADHLKRVILSGEALSTRLQTDFYSKFPVGVTLNNLYGPTEAAIDVSYWACDPKDFRQVPIGHPIANTQLYILDDAMEKVPEGASGELYIGGENLARGYLDQADLTAERFIPNPFLTKPFDSSITAPSDQNTTLYRTGDLARYRDDGAIEYLGRLDHQVKIRGVRIELGEIEHVLEKFDQVQQAIVVAHKESNDTLLVAYITLTSNEPEVIEALKQHARQTLSEPMVPTAFEVLKELPLTPNGKPDRKALPKPTFRKAKYVAPASQTQHYIATIWSDILKIESPSVTDNFFDLGGHSLNATRIASRLRQKFDLEIPLQILFERPVLLDLANHIDSMRISEEAEIKADDHTVLDLG